MLATTVLHILNLLDSIYVWVIMCFPPLKNGERKPSDWAGRLAEIESGNTERKHSVGGLPSPFLLLDSQAPHNRASAQLCAQSAFAKTSSASTQLSR